MEGERGAVPNAKKRRCGARRRRRRCNRGSQTGRMGCQDTLISLTAVVQQAQQPPGRQIFARLGCPARHLGLALYLHSVVSMLLG